VDDDPGDAGVVDEACGNRFASICVGADVIDELSDTVEADAPTVLIIVLWPIY